MRRARLILLTTAGLWILFGLSVGAFNLVRLRRYIGAEDLPRVLMSTALDVAFQAVVMCALMLVFLGCLGLLRRLAVLFAIITATARRASNNGNK